MRRIYIAATYSAPTATERNLNVAKAICVARDLIEAGHAAYCPHLSHYIDQQFPQDYETWMSICDHYLQVCDGLLYLGPSPGADRERDRAIELGIPVYLSVSEITT